MPASPTSFPFDPTVGGPRSAVVRWMSAPNLWSKGVSRRHPSAGETALVGTAPVGRSVGAGRSGRRQLMGEELQGGAGLRLLLAAEVDPVPGQEDPGLGGHLEGLRREALGRQLHD